jgi:acetyltransferase-like isoleucine patch superfamily enzyme
MSSRTIAKRLFHLRGIFVFEQRRLLLNLRGAKIARGAAVAPLTAPGSKKLLCVGSGSFIGRVVLHLHRPIKIGQRVVINDGATIFTASHDVDSPKFATTYGPVIVEDYAWIATGASIMPDVTVGRGAVVGAFSVVTKDVPAFTVVAGNPAKVVKRRTEDLSYNPVASLAAFEAWM